MICLNGLCEMSGTDHKGKCILLCLDVNCGKAYKYHINKGKCVYRCMDKKCLKYLEYHINDIKCEYTESTPWFRRLLNQNLNK